MGTDATILIAGMDEHLTKILKEKLCASEHAGAAISTCDGGGIMHIWMRIGRLRPTLDIITEFATEEWLDSGDTIQVWVYHEAYSEYGYVPYFGVHKSSVPWEYEELFDLSKKDDYD